MWPTSLHSNHQSNRFHISYREASEHMHVKKILLVLENWAPSSMAALGRLGGLLVTPTVGLHRFGSSTTLGVIEALSVGIGLGAKCSLGKVFGDFKNHFAEMPAFERWGAKCYWFVTLKVCRQLFSCRRTTRQSPSVLAPFQWLLARERVVNTSGLDTPNGCRNSQDDSLYGSGGYWSGNLSDSSPVCCKPHFASTPTMKTFS